MRQRREGLLAFGLATAAVVWAVLLIPAALLLPAYSGASCVEAPRGPATCTQETMTFVGANGLRGLLVLLLPAAVAALGWLLLRAKCMGGLRLAGVLAWVCAGALAAFSVVTGLSIGVYVLPTALLLLAAAARTPAASAE